MWSQSQLLLIFPKAIPTSASLLVVVVFALICWAPKAIPTSASLLVVVVFALVFVDFSFKICVCQAHWDDQVSVRIGDE